MEKAKKLTNAEIAALPWGAVVWCETRGEYDCGERGIIKFYDVYPAMKTFSAVNDFDCSLVAGERYHDDMDVKNLPTNLIFWSSKPEAEQMEPGLICMDDAMKIYNESGVL